MEVCYQIMRKKSTLFNTRYQMVKMALEKKIPITDISDFFGVSRKTVYKWIERFNTEGISGLKDKSRKPKNSPKKIPQQEEKKIIKIRTRFPLFGAWRIKQMFGIKLHENTIHKVFKRNNLVSRNKKVKRKNQEQVRAWKEKLKPFEKIQVDVKYLNDIPNLYPRIIKDNFPGFLYSARDVRTGMAFFCYGYEKSAINSTIFISYLFGYLKELNVNIEKVKIQTDNGSEFIGNPSSLKDSSFTDMINTIFKSEHKKIPPNSPTYNSDVETFHKIIQTELFDIEKFKDINEFMAKSYGYQIFYNYERKIKNRGIPIDILKENYSDYQNFEKLFMPVILDSMLTNFIKSVKMNLDQSVTHVYKLSKNEKMIPSYQKNDYFTTDKYIISPIN